MRVGKNKNTKEVVFPEVAARINELRAANQSKISDVSERIAADDEIIDRCSSELDLIVDDIDKALGIEDEMKRARDERAVCLKSIDKLDSMPLISEEEKRDYTRRILEVMQQSNRTANERVNELLLQIMLIYNENDDTITEGNKLLRSLSVNLSRDCYSVNDLGVRQVDENLILKYIPDPEDRLDSVLRPFNVNPLCVRLRSLLGMSDNYEPLVRFMIS